ncbi:MAG: ribulose-bisphosphate carboxylase large subunit family protein [Phreatobacter sp.]|uniref:ribulose-bisphosphate carboxylase large subunit family protein n=1 Tax=Phreatobacter sp. TaxID=1966341 RepID=UPI0027349D3D|nr:ribulose-bisphosphate carboxylase large subunit family protein [Phreatobacter sp.]MDP2800534.1 ribulose-bisphosphate carboxylase large subunit family protein [Phreatobacter sp.]
MDTDQRIEADYWLETSGDPRRTAEIMAGEQSSGTFVAVPGETPELTARAAARIEALELLDIATTPSLPSARESAAGSGRYARARVTLSWPLATLGPSLPNLTATVAGNLYELAPVTGLRLLDIRLPPAFAAAYRGPQFGVAGTRRLAGVDQGPLIGTIVKPSVGFGPAETADLVATLAGAGIDFIKDDELQSDGPLCPFEARVDAVMAVLDAEAQRLGRKVMYAFNLTGDLDQMRRRHDHVLARGGTCVMASVNAVGLVGMIELGRHSQLPIHAHRNGWGYLSRSPGLGWDYRAWHKLWRLAGADHMHVNGLANKFSESDESVIASARACGEPLFAERPDAIMPVFSSGQTVRQAPGTFAALGTTDLIFAAGGGIIAHPDGPAAGVGALREAWEAAVAGEDLDVAARSRPALAAALRYFA